MVTFFTDLRVVVASAFPADTIHQLVFGTATEA